MPEGDEDKGEDCREEDQQDGDNEGLVTQDNNRQDDRWDNRHYLLPLLQATARRVEGTSKQRRRTEEEDQRMRDGEKMKVRGG
jgi:hypothetical protein